MSEYIMKSTSNGWGEYVGELIRCKDCKHQEKYFHADMRRKDGGYCIYGCELAEGYSHVCLDDDFCSRAERKEE